MMVLRDFIEGKMRMPGPMEMEDMGLRPTQRDEIGTILESDDFEWEVAFYVHLSESIRAREPQMELCWTGEPLEGIRMMEPALYDLILDAEKEIIIVGYVFNINAGRLAELLDRKSEEGVKIILILNRLEDDENLMEWARGRKHPLELYSKKKDIHDPLSSLHMKCIVVDSKKAFVGSTNLSFHGLKKNIEIGIIFDDYRLIKKLYAIIDVLKADLEHIEIQDDEHKD